jgi:hypothetical protein
VIDIDLQTDNRPRNQSAEHWELSNRALRWLGARCTGRGVRGGVGVPVTNAYIADAVGIAGFQHRFLKTYLRAAGLQARTYYAGKVAGDIDNEFGCIFEAKVSRADFLSTFRTGEHLANRHVPVAHLHWCVVPAGLISVDELPPFWGLLEAKGRGLSEQRAPMIQPMTSEQLDRLAYQILWYADHSRAWLAISTCPQCLGPIEHDGIIESKVVK